MKLGIFCVFIFQEYEFRVRWPAIKTMTALSTMRASQVQQLILVSPQGVSKLMDLLSDTREVIRNDVSLLEYWLMKLILCCIFSVHVSSMCLALKSVVIVRGQQILFG